MRCFGRLAAVVHKRAETGEQVATAVQSAALPFSALHRLCPLAVGGVPVAAVVQGASCSCWAVCLVALALLCVCLPCSACIAACCAAFVWGERRRGGGWGGGRERSERQVWCSRRRVASLSPVFVGDWGRGRIAGCFAALALLFAVVTQGDAYLFAPLCGFSGGVRSLSSPCPLVL